LEGNAVAAPAEPRTATDGGGILAANGALPNRPEPTGNKILIVTL